MRSDALEYESTSDSPKDGTSAMCFLNPFCSGTEMIRVFLQQLQLQKMFYISVLEPSEQKHPQSTMFSL